ncbi:hypothetical protein DQ04_03551110 [Trypanosoma grayi]|uniref:hypothetical protein n=1 Tax=Trypanosoma grayi TaxID=71804 RepID=UPI0004F48614|nr:hypothetical protein DQ04_03551110 [Trypanosoma grayi]KEG10580.1 hypothetical protein DQ04_03551110 [Trypanosoma grayi]
MQTNKRLFENTPPKRAPCVTGRSSVYPYKAQRFVATELPARRPRRSNKRCEAIGKAAASAERVKDSKPCVEENLFPREYINDVAAWLSGDALFVQVETLAARASDLRARVAPLPDDPQLFASMPPGGIAMKQHKLQGDKVTSPPNVFSFDEETYARRILGRKRVVETRNSALDVESTLCDSVVECAVTQRTQEMRVETSPTAAPMMSLQQIAYGTETSAGRQENSGSPIVVEIKEELAKEMPNLQPSSSSPSSVIRNGVSVSGDTGLESSVGDGAVSLRDASPSRLGAGGIHPSCTTDLYHVVHMPRAHYILQNVNFSSW